MINLSGCIILDEQLRLLLIHRATPTLTEWEIPGGKVEIGESAARAAVRELGEELAIEVVVMRALGGAAFSDTAGTFHYEWFLATILAGKLNILEPEKFDGWRFVAWDELSTIGPLSINVKNFLQDYPAPENLYEHH